MLHINGARVAMLILGVCTHKGGLEASGPLEEFKPYLDLPMKNVSLFMEHPYYLQYKYTLDRSVLCWM